MRTLTLITLLSAACVFGAGPAQAQRGYADPSSHLVQALATFSQQASRIRGGGIAQAVNRFQRTMRRQPGNLQVIAQRYSELRQLLHGAAINDVQILDAWDEVVHSYHEYAESGVGVGVQPPHQGGAVVVAPPVQGHQGQHYFQGTFENTPVTFAGNSPDEVFQRCSQFMTHSRITQVDDISVNGQRYRNGPSFWQNDALCSIAALNSAPAHTVQIRGDAEGTPFAVGAGQQRVLQVYLPRALTSLHVDDLTINGQAYHNQASFWNANEVLNMILSQARGVPQNRVRRRRPRR